MSTTDFAQFIASCPKKEGIVEISPVRRFMHDETQYDNQYQFEEFNVDPGRHLIELLRESDKIMQGPALELGCGTGFLSAGLIVSEKYRPLLISDPSDIFIKIVQRKLLQRGSIPEDIILGIVNGEDLSVLPSKLFTLITMRSVLHHFNDVENFFSHASRLLQSGGILHFYEPCAEAFVLMGALASLLPILTKNVGTSLTENQQKSIQLFMDTMKYYTRQDIDKSASEDKHAFRFEFLSRLAYKYGFNLRYISDGSQDDFESSFTYYLKHCLNFSDDVVEIARLHLRPAFDFVKESAQGTRPPNVIGHFICEKLD